MVLALASPEGADVASPVRASAAAVAAMGKRPTMRNKLKPRAVRRSLLIVIEDATVRSMATADPPIRVDKPQKPMSVVNSLQTHKPHRVCKWARGFRFVLMASPIA
jgi:hypothetical protein